MHVLYTIIQETINETRRVRKLVPMRGLHERGTCTEKEDLIIKKKCFSMFTVQESIRTRYIQSSANRCTAGKTIQTAIRITCCTRRRRQYIQNEGDIGRRRSTYLKRRKKKTVNKKIQFIHIITCNCHQRIQCTCHQHMEASLGL